MYTAGQWLELIEGIMIGSCIALILGRIIGLIIADLLMFDDSPKNKKRY